MIDINKEEYDIVTIGLGAQIGELRRDDPVAMVRRQIPLDIMQSAEKTDTLEIVFKFQFPAKDIIDFVKKRRS